MASAVADCTSLLRELIRLPHIWGSRINCHVTGYLFFPGSTEVSRSNSHWCFLKIFILRINHALITWLLCHPGPDQLSHQPGALIHREGTTVIHRYGVDLATVSAVGGASCVSTATASSLSLGACPSSSTPIPREKRFHF